LLANRTPENQQLWDASLPEYLNGTKMQKLVIVLTRFPKHWLIINQYALPLTFLAITPLLIVGGLARMIKDKVPNYTGLFEDHSQQPPDVPCLIVRSIQSILSYTSNYAVVVAFGVTWWSRSIVLPVVRKWVLPFYLFHVVFGIASLVIACAPPPHTAIFFSAACSLAHDASCRPGEYVCVRLKMPRVNPSLSIGSS
jgi:hypothetical protein